MRRSRKAFLAELGALIRKKRLWRRVSQTALADGADITQKYLCEIEAGKRNPSIETVRRICESLDMKLSRLFKEF